MPRYSLPPLIVAGTVAANDLATGAVIATGTDYVGSVGGGLVMVGTTGLVGATGNGLYIVRNWGVSTSPTFTEVLWRHSHL